MDKHNITNETGTSNLEKCLILLNDPEIKNVVEEHDKNKKAETKLGFNLFRLISDTYYKENLHSAILKAFLDKDEQHKQGDLFLKKFIEFLNSVNNDIKINIDEYSNTSVFCEKGRIDIQIRDNSSGKVIIIENKINNAVDQYQQLPRYLDEVEKTIYKGDRKYKVDCIVYLSPTHPKSPNMADWTSDQIQKIKKLIIPIVAYNPYKEITLSSWIDDCLKQTLDQEDHARFVLLQYQELLKQLAGQIMNTQLMEEFNKKMAVGDNFSIAMSLRDMLEDLIQYRVKNIENTFKNSCQPFTGVWIWKQIIAVFEYLPEYKGCRFKLHIVVENNKYKFQVLLFTGNITVETLLQSLDLEKGFERVNFVEHMPIEKINGAMQRVFKYPEEEQKLFDYINNFKDKLSIVINKSSPTI